MIPTLFLLRIMHRRAVSRKLEKALMLQGEDRPATECGNVRTELSLRGLVLEPQATRTHPLI